MAMYLANIQQSPVTGDMIVRGINVIDVLTIIIFVGWFIVATYNTVSAIRARNKRMRAWEEFDTKMALMLNKLQKDHEDRGVKMGVDYSKVDDQSVGLMFIADDLEDK